MLEQRMSGEQLDCNETKGWDFDDTYKADLPAILFVYCILTMAIVYTLRRRTKTQPYGSVQRYCLIHDLACLSLDVSLFVTTQEAAHDAIALGPC